MRRREIQSFSLKLSDLKEYEDARQARQETAKKDKDNSGTDRFPALAGFGPKSRQQIQERIGFVNKWTGGFHRE